MTRLWWKLPNKKDSSNQREKSLLTVRKILSNLPSFIVIFEIYRNFFPKQSITNLLVKFLNALKILLKVSLVKKTILPTFLFSGKQYKKTFLIQVIEN